jgi:hypothetical protein
MAPVMVRLQPRLRRLERSRLQPQLHRLGERSPLLHPSPINHAIVIKAVLVSTPAPEVRRFLDKLPAFAYNSAF